MSILAKSLVLTPKGFVCAEALKVGSVVLSRGMGAWRENRISLVRPVTVRKVKMVVVVGKPVLSMTVSDDDQYPFEVGASVRCSEGAHVYRKNLDIVENTAYLSEVPMIQLKVDRTPHNIVVDRFIVKV
jgi:hypothetical protein